MIQAGPLHIRKLLNRRPFEPGKVFERNKQLLGIEQNPETIF
jgi:hypothetical protein